MASFEDRLRTIYMTDKDWKSDPSSDGVCATCRGSGKLVTWEDGRATGTGECFGCQGSGESRTGT